MTPTGYEWMNTQDLKSSVECSYRDYPQIMELLSRLDDVEHALYVAQASASCGDPYYAE